MQDKVERVVINNMRYYKVTQFSGPDDKIGIIRGIFPSVTTVLGQTSDKLFLKKWEKKIGIENAQRITENAGKRGTVMHRLCEIYLGLPHEMDKKERLEETLRQSVTDKEICSFDNRSIIVGGMLFYNYIRSGTFDMIKKTVITEKFLWTERAGGYAGTVDNISILSDDSESIIDFKTALKPKDEDWIQDYKLQVSAYAVAAYDRLGTKAKSANILISNEISPTPQIFRLEQKDMRAHYEEFKERLNWFYNKYPPIKADLLNAEDDLF
jgi:genome maintenance exonuclease 1